MSASKSPAAPIAVFDSGVGGVTVVSALQRALPSENILYLGDTARVPYGGKTQATIERYSMEVASLLLGEGAKMLVIACNSASALALARLRREFSVPIVGVIEPGVEAALEWTKTGHVAVIGTKATIGSGAYAKALAARLPDVRVTSVACPLLVPLIEEGLLDDGITDAVLARYLAPVMSGDADTLVLGCTHYPLLAPAISKMLGGRITLVDSAANCARAVRGLLQEKGLLNDSSGSGRVQLAFTDPPDRFLEIAGTVLGVETGRATVRQVPPLGQ